MGPGASHGPPIDLVYGTRISLLASFFVVVANIVVDLCYAVLDPRVRIS
jgi:peptide/nickel transport system permease protein